METPKGGRQRKPFRNPTPRLSERKKNLFAPKSVVNEVDEDLLSGVEPLDNAVTSTRTEHYKTDSEFQPKNVARRSLRLQRSNSPNSTIGANGKENIPIDTTGEETEEQLELLFSASMRLSGPISAETPSKTIFSPESSKVTCSNDIITEVPSSCSKKRHLQFNNFPQASPKRKQIKMQAISLEKVSIPTKSFYSSANISINPTSHNARTSPINYITHNVTPRSKRHDRRGGQPNINTLKGVRHKIRRPTKSFGGNCRSASSADVDAILANLRNEKLRNLITAKREHKVQVEKVHEIFRNNCNPIKMARPLSALAFMDDPNNTYSMDTTDEYLNEKNKSIEREAAFSDIEYEDEFYEKQNHASEITPIISHFHQYKDSRRSSEALTKSDKQPATSTANRKFFKSGRSTNTRKEIKITENIKASMCNGKISLVQHKKEYRRKHVKTAFCHEQEAVNAILKNLDDTTYGDVPEAHDHENFAGSGTQNFQELESTIFKNEARKGDSNYSEFRKRLPYNTSDPELIEQQHLLLDFLISNNICTEKNFTIFIADPDNHKEEASRIVDQVVVIVNENSDFGQRLPYKTVDPILIEQQYSFLDFLMLHNICTEENFDIFIANYETRRSEADSIIANVKAQYAISANPVESRLDITELQNHSIDCNDNSVAQRNDNFLSISTVDKIDPRTNISNEGVEKSTKLFSVFNLRLCQPLIQQSTRQLQRSWTGGKGGNQYQIDAGQKHFGAQQCKQCGLVYTVHEPEEEKLHRDYHASLHVLRFKSWIDEDVVAIFPEWGADGRILRITENSHIKRKERIIDVLKIVDKELGFSSYIIPKTFVAYFAVRKCQIVGLCLVQPLTKANKYLSINGVDCCTEEEYEAKCGISRIWVSPLHRGLYIASKLLEVAQSNTIVGEEIPLHKIAFSAPTESGKMFAQKVTKMCNFLVYQ